MMNRSAALRSLTALVLLAGLPVSFAVAEEPPPPMSMGELGDFAKRYAAAWSSQDPDKLASFYAEQGSISVNGGEPSVGREAIAAKARGFMEGFPDMIVRLKRLERVGRQATFHWHWTGTNTGPGGTGAAVDLTGYEQWTFDENGLILESKGHYDAAEYERQMSAGQ